jgi:hypothetical protein
MMTTKTRDGGHCQTKTMIMSSASRTTRLTRVQFRIGLRQSAAAVALLLLIGATDFLPSSVVAVAETVVESVIRLTEDASSVVISSQHQHPHQPYHDQDHHKQTLSQPTSLLLRSNIRRLVNVNNGSNRDYDEYDDDDAVTSIDEQQQQHQQQHEHEAKSLMMCDTWPTLHTTANENDNEHKKHKHMVDAYIEYHRQFDQQYYQTYLKPGTFMQDHLFTPNYAKAEFIYWGSRGGGTSQSQRIHMSLQGHPLIKRRSNSTEWTVLPQHEHLTMEHRYHHQYHQQQTQSQDQQTQDQPHLDEKRTRWIFHNSHRYTTMAAMALSETSDGNDNGHDNHSSNSNSPQIKGTTYLTLKDHPDTTEFIVFVGPQHHNNVGQRNGQHGHGNLHNNRHNRGNTNNDNAFDFLLDHLGYIAYLRRYHMPAKNVKLVLADSMDGLAQRVLMDLDPDFCQNKVVFFQCGNGNDNGGNDLRSCHHQVLLQSKQASLKVVTPQSMTRHADLLQMARDWIFETHPPNSLNLLAPPKKRIIYIPPGAGAGTSRGGEAGMKMNVDQEQAMLQMIRHFMVRYQPRRHEQQELVVFDDHASGRMSLRDQIALFQQATMVIGGGGEGAAGMANLLFVGGPSTSTSSSLSSYCADRPKVLEFVSTSTSTSPTTTQQTPRKGALPFASYDASWYTIYSKCPWVDFHQLWYAEPTESESSQSPQSESELFVNMEDFHNALVALFAPPTTSSGQAAEDSITSSSSSSSSSRLRSGIKLSASN